MSTVIPVNTIELESRGKMMVCRPEISRSNGSKSRGAVTARGKAIASRNATKHGLLAEKPPILASEDLETFEGVMQSLVDQYQPANPLEWHYVQTIAMCIQRQHRVWVAEAAVGNAALLPSVEKPYTDEKYPTQKKIELSFGNAEFHPDNLKQERKLITHFLKRFQVESFPTELRSKYWSDIWQEWCGSIQRELEDLQKDYPVDIDHFRDKRLFQKYLGELHEANHPFARALFCKAYFDATDCPTSKSMWEYRRSQFAELLECFQARLKRIDEIETEIQQEQERYQREKEERRLQIANPIPEQILLISRYESHIAKQMKEAIAQLRELQSERKT